MYHSSCVSCPHLFYPVWVPLSSALADVHLGGVDTAWLWEAARDRERFWVRKQCFSSMYSLPLSSSHNTMLFLYSVMSHTHTGASRSAVFSLEMLKLSNFLFFFHDFGPNSPLADGRPRMPSPGCPGSSSLPCPSSCRSCGQRKWATHTESTHL